MLQIIMASWKYDGTNCEMSSSPPPSMSSDAHAVNTRTDSPTLTPGNNSITPTVIDTTSLYSSPITPTTATAFDFTTTTTTTTISDGDSLLNSPQCERTFTSCIGLVGHLRIHRTKAGVTVPVAPTYSRRARLPCPHCCRTFTHRMGLLGHMRLHATYGKPPKVKPHQRSPSTLINRQHPHNHHNVPDQITVSKKPCLGRLPT
ncbi:unnamed protein product [Schistocephalus solidus]|uniref:C2H2-type domain-containing protein n=1 Tax=Schistocephalus solidus TaxID=70667 RepID=A0A183SE04_SCHSO|nr:unnamed protein product [Schistocephalus solidus]